MSSGSGLFALFGFDFESWSIIQIWSRQWILKEKNAFFKLTCVAYKTSLLKLPFNTNFALRSKCCVREEGYM